MEDIDQDFWFLYANGYSHGGAMDGVAYAYRRGQTYAAGFKK